MKDITCHNEVTRKYMTPHNDIRMINENMLCMS